MKQPLSKKIKKAISFEDYTGVIDWFDVQQALCDYFYWDSEHNTVDKKEWERKRKMQEKIFGEELLK